MRVEVFPDSEWADEVGRLLAERVSDRSDLNLCLPTGSTPVPAYAVFADGGVDASGCRVFLLDEFVLPRGSAGRCDAMIQRDLLDLLDPNPEVIGWDTSGDLDVEVDRMEAAVKDAGGLDLALLGLGANGHIGVNEPGSTVSSRARVVKLEPGTSSGAVRYGADVVPTFGMTLGVANLLEAAEVWLMVTGAHKADVLAEVLNGPIGSDLPASFLRLHPNALVLADESAASEL